ncbi:MAG: phage protease [Sulfuricurvum sp.]|uniref:phage protease n=1 Tax=Sulfuricurvum sp. TaxID=2025608 RepID=UPI003563EDEE
MKRQGKLKNIVELNFKQGEKIKVSPVGSVIGLDGRAFVIDGQALIDSITKNALDIPIDENHNFGRATGWLPHGSFELRSDGIYASVEWTTDGEGLVSNRSYRYLSPVYLMGDNRKVIGLDSVGLVNTPNLLNTALNKQEEDDSMEKDLLEKELNTVKAQNTELNTKVTTLSDQLKEANAKLKEANDKLKAQMIDVRITSGELLPNAKEFAMTLDGAALDQFLELNKTNTKHLNKRIGTEANVQELDEATKAVNAQLGIEGDKK